MSDLLRATVLGLLVVAGQVVALDDPTRPQHYRPATQAQNLALESVLIGAARSVAVINGQVLTIGDSIDGAEVVRIEAGAVVLSRSGRLQTLKPRRSPVKAKADPDA